MMHDFQKSMNLGRSAWLASLLCLAICATDVAAASAAPNKVLHREVERDEALMRGWLKSLPPGSGVIMVREEGELLLRFPANLVFDPESTAVSGEAAQSPPLAATERLLKRRKQLSAQIVVYADNIGGANLNQSLTDQRAHALADLLHEQGVSAQRITSQGAGSAEPVGSNDTPEGRIGNRRVEIRLRRPLTSKG
jgi:outer membrane protein OmpA-like peptidoglycan-associated protein